MSKNLYENYTPVELITDKYQDDGVSFGSLGYIIEVYGDGNYEVEFSDPQTGITIAQIVVQHTEVKVAL